MTDRTEMPNPIRFGPFEVWSDTQTLRKNGTRLKLPTQAIEILLILLRNPGRVTTREELKQRLGRLRVRQSTLSVPFAG
jgi:DNA-binding response OmpR family regulator